MRYIQLRMEGTYRRWKLRGLAGSNVYGDHRIDFFQYNNVSKND